MIVLKSLFSIRLLLLLDNIGWNDNDNSIIIIPAYIIPSVGHKPPFQGEEETCTVVSTHEISYFGTKSVPLG